MIELLVLTAILLSMLGITMMRNNPDPATYQNIEWLVRIAFYGSIFLVFLIMI